MFSHFKSLSLRSKLLFVVVVVVSILIPARFWHDVWFGRTLSDTDLQTALQTESKPRLVQHALTQIEEEIRAQDSNSRKWYPAVANLSNHPEAVVRLQAAWVMGQDNTETLFETTLLKLLEDSDLLVRRNAALALVRFQRPEALSVIRSMLRPLELTAPLSGNLNWRAQLGFRAELGDNLGQVGSPEDAIEITSPLTATVNWLLDQPTVEAGAVIARLGVDPGHAREALRALYLLGTPEDIKLIESLEGQEWVTEDVSLQIEATRKRLSKRE